MSRRSDDRLAARATALTRIAASEEPSDATPQLRITKPDTGHFAAGKHYLAEAEQIPVEDWRNLDRLLRIADLHFHAADIEDRRARREANRNGDGR